MTLFTIGFSGKSAESFFSSLGDAGVRRLLDIRLNPAGQLSGFAKARDLPFFLHALCRIEYHYVPTLAPPRFLLDSYRSKLIDWSEYERVYLATLKERAAASSVNADLLEAGCLLCSEESSRRCHRRLAAEFLANHFPALRVQHL